MNRVSSTERVAAINVPPYDYPASWLIGATTYAIDRMVPDLERIYQPPGRHDGGTVHFRLAAAPIVALPRPRTSRKLRLLNRFRPPKLLNFGNKVFFDAREDDYFNWSHQVNFYLTLAIAARDWVDDDVTVVLRPGLPPITRELYRMFGFEVAATDGPVRGRQCCWAVSHWEVVAAGRKQLAPGDYALPHCATPTKVFLARRGSRSILNEAEVEAALPGFSKVYAEDLTLAEQFALFCNATHIVAIHGAGLAPLQYRRSRERLRLVEIAPIGHMTRWFGIMCHQVGGSYASARGKLKPEYVPYLYGTSPYLRHSADNFEVDPKSVLVALEMIS